MLHVTHAAHWTNSHFQLAKKLLVARRTPDLYVASLGRFFSDGRFVFEQVSPGYSLHVVHSGAGIMEMDGVPYSVGAGDLFLFFPGSHIRYHDFPQSPWRYTWIGFGGKNLQPAMKEVGFTRSRPHRHGDYSTVMEPVFREIETVYRREHIPATFAIAAGWRLLDALAQQMPERAEGQVGMAEMARALMDADDKRILTVDAIARQLKVSRSALFRNFRSAYRTSPKDYLESSRIDQARRLLKQGRSSIKEIAAACGYANAQYFCRAFRLRCHTTPSRFRAAPRRKTISK